MSIGVSYRCGSLLAALLCFLSAIPSAHAQPASGPATSAESIMMQADALNEQGRFALAEPLYRKALEMQQSAVGEMHLATAQAYDNLGSNLSQQGRYAEADALLRKSLEIVRSNLGEVDGGVAASYNNLAANLFAWGRYKEAEPFYRRALEINRAALGENHPNTATSYTNLAANLVRQGRRAEADNLTRQAPLDEHSANASVRLTIAARYSSTGYSLFTQSRYSEAEPYFRKALEITLALRGETHPDTAINYINLASTLSGLGSFVEAEPLYRQALEASRTALGENHPYTARGYSNLATNLNQQSRYAEAESLSARAVETARRATQAGLGTTDSDQSSSGSMGRPFEDLFGDYLGVAWNLSTTNPAERARLTASAFRVAQDAMRSKSAVAMAQAAIRTAGGSDALARAARDEQDLTALVADLDNKLLAALGQGNPVEEKGAKAQYDSAVARLALAGARINSDFPAYRELVSSQPLELDEVQRALGPDEGLLVLMESGESIYSFAVTSRSVAWNWIDQADTKRVLEQIITLRCEVDWKTCPAAEQYRLDLIPFTPFEEKLYRRYDLDKAYALYQKLIAPVATALHGAKRLYVTSSGTLGDLPLGMLADAPPPASADFADPAILLRARWFGDRFAMTSLPAVSALRLKALRKAGQPVSTQFRGYGDPLLDGTNLPDGGYGFFQGGPGGSSLADPARLNKLQPLPGTRTELSAMAGLFGGESTLHLGSGATESAIRRDKLLETAGVIAFATHGLLPSRKFKLDEPGLVFTPPTTPSATDDGILTASEASALSLAADWVILSACNTASIANGAGGNDNLSALSRGFLYAGANALLASHWRVSDEATAALTVETLSARRADSKITRARALQLAMRSIRTGRRADGTPVPGWSEEWIHPVAWAAFTHVANHDQ